MEQIDIRHGKARWEGLEEELYSVVVAVRVDGMKSCRTGTWVLDGEVLTESDRRRKIGGASLRGTLDQST